MTGAPGAGTTLECTSFGATGSERLVVLPREDGGSAVDPDPDPDPDPDTDATARHGVRVLAIPLRREEVSAPGAYGGERRGA